MWVKTIHLYRVVLCCRRLSFEMSQRIFNAVSRLRHDCEIELWTGVRADVCTEAFVSIETADWNFKFYILIIFQCIFKRPKRLTVDCSGATIVFYRFSVLPLHVYVCFCVRISIGFTVTSPSACFVWTAVVSFCDAQNTWAKSLTRRRHPTQST